MLNCRQILLSLFLVCLAHSVQEIPFLSFTSILGNGIVVQQFVAGDQISFTASLFYGNNAVTMTLIARNAQTNARIDNNIRGINSITDNIVIGAPGKYYLYCQQQGTISKLGLISYLIRKNGAILFSKSFESILGVIGPNLVTVNYFSFSVTQFCSSMFVSIQSYPSLIQIYKTSDLQRQSQGGPTAAYVYFTNNIEKPFSLLPADYILLIYQLGSNPNNYGSAIIRKMITFCDKLCKSPQNIFQQPLCSDNCGDGIKSVKEDCDNGNKTGCSKNCVPDPNYRCYGPVGSTSSCVKDAVYGDGILDLGQECDTGNKTGCSSGCKLDAGYKCTQQTGKPSLCSLCGNGILEYGEEYDNRNQAGCSYNCRVDVGFSCRGVSPSVCLRKDPVCGNGVVEIAEMCDDSNLVDGDGCSRFCRVETGFGCLGEFGYKSSCSRNQNPVSVCGNSVFEPFASSTGLIEQCDNGNQQGCQGCVIQSGFFCSSVPGRQSSCFAVVAPTCGNSVLDIGEQCEDGNIVNGDGCSNFCKVEFGWTCRIGLACTRNQAPPPPATQPFCGNGIVEQGEQCDNGFPVVAGDGCNTICRIQQGWTCQIIQDFSKCRRREN